MVLKLKLRLGGEERMRRYVCVKRALSEAGIMSREAEYARREPTSSVEGLANEEKCRKAGLGRENGRRMTARSQEEP